MSEDMEKIESQTQEALTKVNQSQIPEREKLSLSTRIQTIRNIAMANKNKIWMRTKPGKQALEKLREGTEELIPATEKLGENPDPDLEETRLILDNLETRAREINEEIRKRSMTVT
jgi:hypothetical protein